jgi:hypothetical protein
MLARHLVGAETAVGRDRAGDVEGAFGGDADGELEELVDPALLLG